uniref:Uncharacterized protein n=1 Tax=Candidatus Methanogaster sp. ANME-2c ERB4 TaxID=2759911 RepID=A0A7G9YM48_9EURY|nr:hypothetical protein CPECMPGB_00001 [Methanosarcinales archaeon ANME-2c ERB4]
MRQLRNRPDVVEVPVRADYCANRSVHPFHHGVIRYRTHLDQIKRMHPFDLHVFVNLYLIETEPHVQNDYVFADVHSGHIPTHLIVSADANNSNVVHYIPLFLRPVTLPSASQ